MTLREKQVVSAYTGTLMCSMDKLCEYIEELLGRSVYTHELANHDMWEYIKEKSKPEFLEICKRSE